MKKIIVILGSLALLGAIMACITIVYILQSAKAPGPLGETKIVMIERGKGVAAIAQKLENEHVIDSALVFKIKAK